jgi:subtilisin family serine protease
LAYREVVDAIYWSADNGINIISMSLGWTIDYPALRQACESAYNRGVLLIAAAGNDNAAVEYPAAYPWVNAVGAVYRNLTRWERSNKGPELDPVAPGVNINSTWLNDGYKVDTGTSTAVPHVTATAALIWSSKTDPEFEFGTPDGVWSNEEVMMKLRQMPLRLGQPGSTGRNDEYGYGLVNAWGSNQRPLGDITYDFKVDGQDVAIAAAVFGAHIEGDGIGLPRTQKNKFLRADINIDLKVDGKDIAIISRNYGKIDP